METLWARGAVGGFYCDAVADVSTRNSPERGKKHHFEEKSRVSATSDECFPSAVSVGPSADRRADEPPWSHSPTAGICHFRCSVSCCGCAPSYTQTHTQAPIKINTHHLSPVERSISRAHMVSSGSQALLTRSADVDASFKQPDS